MRRSAVAVAALLLAGCTGTSGDAGRPPADGATSGGVLRVGITAPGSIDPGNDYEPMGDLVLRAMCDPLIGVDAVSGELRPALVQSWVVSDSGQRLVLRLRKGATFSDGTPVTADDVAFTLSRIASAEFASASAAQLELIDGYPEVHGDTETEDDTERRKLRGVKVLDELSVDITLAARQGDFLRLLTSRLTTPVPRDRVTRNSTTFARQPVCSGPYALEKPYRAGDTTIRLRRVSDYRPADSTLTRGGAGYADQLDFRIYPSAAEAARAQRAGQVDIAAASPTDRSKVQTGPGALVEYVGFPSSTTPVFDKQVVRRALALALDREALVRQVFPGTRVPATGFLPPTTAPVFQPGACGDLPVRGDLPAAKTLLAGRDLRGLKVPFYVNTDGRNVQLAQAVAAQWKAALGITAVVTPLKFDAYVRRATSAQGFNGPFRFSWATPYADPDGALYPLFSSERVGRDNFSRYSNAGLDRTLVRQAREAEDAADRLLEYRAAEQTLCRELPMLPLTFSLSRYLVSDRVQSAVNTYVDRSSGQPLLRELYLAD